MIWGCGADLTKSRVHYLGYSLFKNTFEASIKFRLRADVPIGYCLSGGLDSSSIVCMADKIVKESAEKIKQYTVSSCFEDKQYDEQEYIDEVVAHTGVNPYRL